MASADGKVVIDCILNDDGFSRGVTKVNKQVSGLGNAVKKLGGVIASAFAVKALVDFGKEAVELGSNVSEVQNVVDTAFGDMAYKVEQFSSTAIQNFGMSTLAAKKTASTYMAMGKSMGLSEESASDMAISLAGLTGDVASFYNISQELADVKLKGVFTGETEALKELGVVMTQANLEAYAMEQGITKSIDSMTQAEKVALRYGYVTKTLSLAQGDFAKTSDSWANQTRILSMQWQEFMSIIGQALITVLTPAVRVLNEIVGALINVANAVNTTISSLYGAEKAEVAGVAEKVNEGVDAQNAMTDATKETAKAQKKLLAGFDEINKLGGGGESESGGNATAGIAIGGLATISTETQKVTNSGLLEYFKELSGAIEPFRVAFETAIFSIVSNGAWIKTTFTQVWTDLSLLASPLTTWFTDDFLVYVQGFVVTFGSIIGNLLEIVGEVFTNLWSGVIMPNLTKWTTDLPNVFNGVLAVFDQFVVTAGNVMAGIFDTVAMVFSDVWNLVVGPVVTQWIADIYPMLTEFVSQFTSTFGVLFAEVKTIFDKIWQEGVAPALAIISNIWTGLWDGVVNAWDKHGAPIFEKVREAIQGTSGFFQNVWDTILKPIWDNFMGVVDNLWNKHLKPLWDNFLDFVGELVGGAIDIYNGFILPLVNWFVDKFGPHIANAFNNVVNLVGGLFGTLADIATNIIDSLKGVINFVVGVFTGDWQRAFDGIKNIFKGIINAMITIVESFCNFFVRAINKVISAANSLSFDVPDWVPFVGGKSWGLNIPEIKEITLPRLATGAVIPPNREFMAVLGDQKSGTNIETPLSTMVQAFRMALQDMGGGQSEAVMVVDDEVFARVVYKLNKQESQRIGLSLSGGGA